MVSPTKYRQRVELTEMLLLHGKLNQPVRKLSLGERMKAELLAALLQTPGTVLDEPTLGLDVNAQACANSCAVQPAIWSHSTLTSHYMADITALCQRVLVIHQGLI